MKAPEAIAHQQWRGYVQPVGLVVSIPALVQAQAYVNRNIAPDHQRFLDCLTDDDTKPPAIADLARFTQEVLGWEPTDVVPWSADNPAHLPLEVALPEYHEVLRPTHVVPAFVPPQATGKSPRTNDKGPVSNDAWLMLVQQWPLGQDLDKTTAPADGHWQATPQARIERLLLKTQVPTGLLFNGTELRLVYAPHGESSGYMTFRVKEMAEVAGRPIFAGLHMLLEAPRLFSMAEKQRLPAILADSRKYQNVVSTQLAEQAYHAARHDFYSRIRSSASTLVNTQVGNHVIFTIQPTDRIFALTLNVYDLRSFAAFCVLQSRPHELWARFFGSHMKDDLRYTPSTCFETFPFPSGVLQHAAADAGTTDHGPLTTQNPKLTTLESADREYYEFRAALMVRNNEGLTKTYNRFHDPHERSPDILKLRELHAAMDRAVLEAYGWHDLANTATCEFLLDYEDEEDDEQLTSDHGPRTSRRKKPWRYRWPDDFRDEVLARLLALNKERAEQERLAGQLSVDSGQLPEKKGKRAAGKPKSKKSPKRQGPALPGF